MGKFNTFLTNLAKKINNNNKNSAYIDRDAHSLPLVGLLERHVERQRLRLRRRPVQRHQPDQARERVRRQ